MEEQDPGVLLWALVPCVLLTLGRSSDLNFIYIMHVLIPIPSVLHGMLQGLGKP